LNKTTDLHIICRWRSSAGILRPLIHPSAVVSSHLGSMTSCSLAIRVLRRIYRVERLSTRPNRFLIRLVDYVIACVFASVYLCL